MEDPTDQPVAVVAVERKIVERDVRRKYLTRISAHRDGNIPVELTGESPAEKQSIGTVVQYLNEIKVEALPADLPEKFTVDVSALSEVDQAIMVKDLKYDKSKVDIKTGAEEIVAKVEPPQKEEVIEAPAPVEGEVPAEGAAEGTGGAQPAEGGENPTEAPKE